MWYSDKERIIAMEQLDGHQERQPIVGGVIEAFPYSYPHVWTPALLYSLAMHFIAPADMTELLDNA